MAVEKLTIYIERLVTEVPFDHPDRAYLERLRERHVLYEKSALRESQVHKYEGRGIFLRNKADRKKIIDSVFPIVSNIFGVPEDAIVGTSRLKEFMIPRFAASYLLHMVGGLGSSEIAKLYGGRNHTTIINHITRARTLLAEDLAFSESISEAEEVLGQLVNPSPKPANGLNGWHK